MASKEITKSETIKNEPIWQDRDIRFDSGSRDLQLRSGETLVSIFKQVEDTKGNSGDLGILKITNLRMMWQSRSKSRINLSVGLSCITSISNRTLASKLRGKYDSLHIMTKINGTRYEFIYTQFNEEGTMPLSDSSQVTTCLSATCKAYSATKLFRDLKLRSAIISSQTKLLKTLPGEQIYNKINGVWNLSSDQGNLGTMHLTNVRVVWHANMNELFNLSLPYLQISGIRIRESKFGTALVIESSPSSGGYVLGFRIDPVEKLDAVYNELINLYKIHATNPNLGVEEALQLDPAMRTGRRASDAISGTGNISESDFVEESNESKRSDPIAAYLTGDGDTSISKDNQVVFCPQIGLAIEKLKDGFTLESLWKVLPDDN